MNRNRIFRLLVCLILVCCLLIQVSPIRAQALAIVDDLAIGYAALLILAAAGVIFCPTTAKEVTAIGNSMTNELREWGKATGMESDVELWIAGITLFDGDPSNDGSGEQRVKMARGLLAGLAAWVCSVVLATTEIETEEQAEVGFAYYNGILLPKFLYSSGYFVLVESVDGYEFYWSNVQLFVRDNSTYLSLKCKGYWYKFMISDSDQTQWESTQNLSDQSIVQIGESYNRRIVWTFEDLLYNTGGVYMSATEPVDYLTTILYPETYVGDIPQKIQDGELDEDTLIIPDINYAPLLQPDLTLEESLQNTMQQLKDGTLTYDDFMEQIKVEEETEPDPDPSEDPSEDPTTNVDGDTWTPPTDPNAFALDLSNYFPFCIPFDLYDFLSCLNADPVAPVLEWQVPLPGGSTYPIEIDLSIFDPVAKILRTMQLLLFCIGLAFKTRDLIKG